MENKKTIQQLLRELEKTEHGFAHIVTAGNKLLQDTSLDIKTLAVQLFTEKSYQARMLATYLLGHLAAADKTTLDFLKKEVAADNNWRVQEMLAKAFDQYCSQSGYKESLPIIKKWLADKNPNVVRAVIEGLRIWTARPFFKEHPQTAITLISTHKSNASEYVRKSVGNALRDIGKKHLELVQVEIAGWDTADPLIYFTLKLVNKKKV
jgi:3-methyladenine DNA glycosylase AlkD